MQYKSSDTLLADKNTTMSMKAIMIILIKIHVSIKILKKLKYSKKCKHSIPREK